MGLIDDQKVKLSGKILNLIFPLPAPDQRDLLRNLLHSLDKTVPVNANETMSVVKRCFLERETWTAGEICDRCAEVGIWTGDDQSRHKVYNNLLGLIRQGRISRAGYGKYTRVASASWFSAERDFRGRVVEAGGEG